MNTTLIGNLASLRIGTVEYVSPDELKILLDIEAPDNVALNTGQPRSFPRINGYLLVPIDQGFLVGQISWITIERSNFPIRKGLKDFGLIDLPFPLRKLCLQPIGTLTCENSKFTFSRGVECFPSVGDVVLLPTDEQLRCIIESGDERRVYIGNSVLISGAQVKIDPDKLFGRHLAVLGNTGSGKSCSVAGLIRWSLENAKKCSKEISGKTNSRFIVLDPNGEYSKAFGDMPESVVYSVEPFGNEQQLKIPLWLWNADEWCGFTKATAKTQRPTIIQALKSMRAGVENASRDDLGSFANFLRTIITSIKMCVEEGMPWGNFPKNKAFFDLIKVWSKSIHPSESFPKELQEAIQNVQTKLVDMLHIHDGKFPSYLYERPVVLDLLQRIQNAFYIAGGREENLIPINPDCPKPFKGQEFLNAISASAEILHTTEYIDSTLNLIKTLINDAKLKDVVTDTEITLDKWLAQYVGLKGNSSLVIIDLSLLPTQIVTTITAVISRLIFEALQRYRKNIHQCLPTVLVVEEAHHFIKKINEDSESVGSDALCCKIFEKIAREGRKFGLGLLISSQRPSELSPTVLSQCNSFLIHRISNDRDQELIRRLLPDNMHGMLRELPSLPSQNAILMGWAAELPTLVKMRYLPPEQRPQSDDPDFWDVWTCKEKRDIQWEDIANEWQK